MHRRRLAYGSDWVYPPEMANLQLSERSSDCPSFARMHKAEPYATTELRRALVPVRMLPIAEQVCRMQQ